MTDICCKKNEYLWCKDEDVIYTDNLGNSYCLFHAPLGKKGIPSIKFNEIIFEKIRTTNEKGHVCNLRGTIFEGDINFGILQVSQLHLDFKRAEFHGDVSFSKSVFKERANFAEAIFYNKVSFFSAVFENDAHFPKAVFKGAVSFAAAVFKKRANFQWLVFENTVRFTSAIFFGKTNFLESRFHEKASFTEIQFNKITRFAGVIFWNEAQFSKSIFLKDTSFARANFKAKSFFNGAEFNDCSFSVTVFEDNVSFFECKFMNKLEFLQAHFYAKARFSNADFDCMGYFTDVQFNSNVSFLKAKILKEIHFSGKTFLEESNFRKMYLPGRIRFNNTDIRRTSFLYTDLLNMDFVNCIWLKKSNRAILSDEVGIFRSEFFVDLTLNRSFKKSSLLILQARLRGTFSEILKRELECFRKDISCDKEAIKKVEVLYRRLKQKFKEEHNEQEVSNWHYNEKEMFRKGSRWRRFVPVLSVTNLYWFTSGYGERPFRAGMVLLLLITVLSLLGAYGGLAPASTASNNVGGSMGVLGIDDMFQFRSLWAVFLNTLQNATFQKTVLFNPTSLFGETVKVLAHVVVPIQTTLFALALRNRFRR